MQRLIGLRTMVTRGSAEAGALALTGVVIADPNGLGVVQPSTAGRISGRLPALGERVSAGQLLAVITPALDADVSLTTARGAAESALAEAQLAAGPGGLAAEAAELAQAESRLTRLVGLEGVVPDRAIAEARTEVVAARARLSLARSQAAARLSTARSEAARLRRAGSGAETLRAPVSGVISTVAAAQGQVVSPGETVFTIVNPARLLVEARAPAGAVAVVAQAASGRTADGRSLTLARQGEGLSMVDGAAPLRFRVTQSDPLRVGEPVTVFAARGQTAPGIAIPRDAVTRGANGQAVVFVKQSAERFAATSVTVVDLDATRVLVTNGLSPGARVATTGAALLAQVR
jgi:multidrug efflux pump subunit AcrA (membrane-fusion protein)